MKNNKILLVFAFCSLIGIAVFVFFYLKNKKTNTALLTAQSDITSSYDVIFEKMNNTIAIINDKLKVYQEEFSSKVLDFAHRIEELEYIPIQILTFTNNKNIVEKGTVVNSIIFNFTFNKVIETGSINNNIGDIVPIETTLMKGVNVTQNTIFTLTVSDGKQTATKTSSLLFQNKAYWGVSDDEILTNEQILALSNSVLTTTKTRNYNINGEGKKLVYAVPSSFGNVSFKLGGFPFTALTKRTQNVTNALGNTTSYDIYVTDTVQFGTNIQVEAI